MKEAMFRKPLYGVLVLLVLAAGIDVPVLRAETISAPDITVNSSVPDAFTVNVDLRQDVSGFPDITPDSALNFGAFVKNAAGDALIVESGIVAFITTNTQRRPYTVVSDITSSLTSGTDQIPDGAFVLNAVYSPADNGGQTNEGTANYSGSAVGTHAVYTSGGSHRMSTVQAHYTITDDPALGATGAVPLDQSAGSYSTALTISVTR